MAPAFISIKRTLLDAEAPSSFAMPARPSALNILLFLLLDADALSGIAMPARASASNSVGILMNVEAMLASSQKARMVFWKPVPKINQTKMFGICLPLRG